MSIAYLIDSSTEWPWEKPENVFSVPLYVNRNEHSVRDDGSQSIPSLLDEMAKGVKDPLTLPKTSQPTPNDFRKALEAIREAGHDQVISLLIPPSLSGTFRNAESAFQEVQDLEYFLPPLRTYSMATTLILEKLLSSQLGFEDQKRMIQDLNARAGILAVADSLKYAHAQGRIGGAAYLVGSVLRIVPVLTVDDSGVLAKRFVARTIGKAIDFMTDTVPKGSEVLIGYAGMEMQANELREKLVSKGVNILCTYPVRSASLTVNTGPFFAVAYI